MDQKRSTFGFIQSGSGLTAFHIETSLGELQTRSTYNMPSIHTSITINAPPSVVRKVFFDFPAHPQWNPWFTSIESPITPPSPGTRLKFVAYGTTNKPVVFENTPDTFSWVGSFIGEWFFKGHHFFKFEPFGDVEENGETVGCKFIQYEDFSGLGSWIILLFIHGVTTRGFNALNAALKAKAESMQS